MGDIFNPIGAIFGGSSGGSGALTLLDPTAITTMYGGPSAGVDVLEGDSFLGSTGQMLADPLDLFGVRAGQTADLISAIYEESARAGIALNQAQIDKITELTQPFREASTETALPQLSSLAFGGEVDYQPSKLFETQLASGREDILQQQAAGAGVKSSATFGRLADLISGLASEDVGRYESGQLALSEIGRGAEQSLSGAGTALTGNISNILGGLGANTQNVAAQLAGQQVASGQTAGNLATSIGNLLLAT